MKPTRLMPRYNSAIKSMCEYPEDSKLVEFHQSERLIAFQHAVAEDSEVPHYYNDCDVIYSEPGWMQGQKVFNERSGVSMTWAAYVKGYRKFIDLGIPILITAGAQHVRSIGVEPQQVLRVKLVNQKKVNAEVMLVAYNFEYEGPHANTIQVMHNLAQRFRCIGDPSCGFGNTARFALAAGRAAVVSDMDSRCIGYIESQADEWRAVYDAKNTKGQ